MEQVACPQCARVYARWDGIWRFLLPERAACYTRFIEEYTAIRHAEGRGAPDAAYYRALPEVDRSGQMSADWAIRRRSFAALLKQVVAPMEQAAPMEQVAPPAVPQTLARLRILDLGAGNGWLSNRLAERGHAVLAVDLLDDRLDGLGAAVHYVHPFVPLQAEFDRLPLAGGQADVVIFNASFHYTTRAQDSLAEARRVLAPGGRIVILDTPIYNNPHSGIQMVREREAAFTRRYGYPSNALPSENFMTPPRLDELAADTGLRWQTVTPFYGWRWAFKPLLARLLGRREPARFRVIIWTTQM